MINVINNFLPDELYKELRDAADNASFAGVENPLEGIVYPDVSIDIPDSVAEKIISSLSELHGYSEIAPSLMFLRLTTENTSKAPHIVHSDLEMGGFSLMLYLSEGGSTDFMHHETGFNYHPSSDEELTCWQSDTNDVTKWSRYESVDMAENRAVIFDAGLMHMAAPVGGFGKNQKDGRLVLTCFYDTAS